MKFHDHITDSELLEQFVSSGSQAAFAALVQRHGAMVRAVAMRVLANHHDAQDVTQAVFIKLAKEAGKLMGQASVAGWLHTVSHRLSLNARQSRESRQKREHTAMNQATTADKANEGIAIRFRRELDAALDSLPERYRQPLVLFHMEGAPLHKCAELLELHPATLRTRLSRARDMLRGSLVRRGVEVASVAGLASLLAAEAKASVLPPALMASILDTAGGGGAAVSPAVLKLANTTVKFKSAGTSTLILTPLIIMKTKTTTTAIAALIIAALCTTTYIVRQSDSSDSANRRTGSDSSSPSSGQTRATKKSVREATDHLSQMTQDELFVLLVSVSLISDEAERLVATREKLGMNISDEVYRKALADYGYSPSLKDRERFYGYVIKSWLDKDPIEVMSWSNRFNKKIRSRLMVDFIGQWIEKDATTAMAWAEKNLEGKELRTVRVIMASIQQTNADKLSIDKIAGQMLTIKEPSGKNEEEYDALQSRIYSALSAISKDDPKAALDVFHSLDPKIRNGDGLYGIEENLYNKFARKDPATAISSYITLESEINNTRISSLYSIWARKDPDAAIASAMSLDAEKRGPALLATLPSWQIKYPNKKIENAADLSLLDKEQYNTLIRNLTESIALTDPSAAAAYAMDMEDESMKKEIITTVTDLWAKKDPKEAERWLGTLPKGDLRDRGLASVANSTSFDDMARTKRLTSQINDPEFRHEVIVDILTFSDSIRNDLPGVLQLADQLPSIDSRKLDLMMMKLDPGDLYSFEVWLRDQNAKGRITYSSENKTEEFQQMLDNMKEFHARRQ